jgi:hypothetical protein
LDAGTLACWPKVVVFDLRRNEEVRQIKQGHSQQRKNMAENKGLGGIYGGSKRKMDKSM